ncbi:MAG: dihydroorotase [Candidatus Heimdallarchaeaceae archaeon]
MVEFSDINVWDNKKQAFIQENLIFSTIDASSPLQDKKLEGSSLYAIPPAIDIHVHFREPGYIHKETILSGANAALYGGVLTVLDMPNTNPITDSVKALIHKKELAKKSQYVDILFAAAITDINISELEAIDSYCDAYKIFLAESFGNLKISKENLHKSLVELERLATQNPLIFHAEDNLILEQFKNEESHNKKRPPEAEAVAVQTILKLARDFPTLHFHITHISSSISVQLLKLASLSNLTTDTCPRYLWFDDSYSSNPLFKVNPPIRTKRDREELQRAVAIGLIDIISSDHSPHTLEEKTKLQLSGMPGVQELLPSTLTLVKSRELEWERAIESFHTLPKKLLNLPEEKFKDDFIIIDMDKPFQINKNWIKTKVQWSAFTDKQLFGKISYVVKNGELIQLH